jgi:hypothetical protein
MTLLARLMRWSRFGWHHGYTTQAKVTDRDREILAAWRARKAGNG